MNFLKLGEKRRIVLVARGAGLDFYVQLGNSGTWFC